MLGGGRRLSTALEPSPAESDAVFTTHLQPILEPTTVGLISVTVAPSAAEAWALVTSEHGGGRALVAEVDVPFLEVVVPVDAADVVVPEPRVVEVAPAAEVAEWPQAASSVAEASTTAAPYTTGPC